MRKLQRSRLDTWARMRRQRGMPHQKEKRRPPRRIARELSQFQLALCRIINAAIGMTIRNRVVQVAFPQHPGRQVYPSHKAQRWFCVVSIQAAVREADRCGIAVRGCSEGKVFQCASLTDVRFSQARIKPNHTSARIEVHLDEVICDPKSPRLCVVRATGQNRGSDQFKRLGSPSAAHRLHAEYAASSLARRWPLSSMYQAPSPAATSSAAPADRRLL